MNYMEDILDRFLNQLETRKESTKPLSLYVAKIYRDYRDNFSESQELIDAAVSRLVGWGWVVGQKDAQGYYTKITMSPPTCTQAYALLHRKPKTDVVQEQKDILTMVQLQNTGLVCSVCSDFLNLLEAGGFPGYGIGKDTDKLKDVLLILEKIDKLETETYIRNFSEAIFHDSKRFQTLQSTVVRILMDYTPDAIQEESILEQYELYQNPTYVYLKGGWLLNVNAQPLDISLFPGGIGLPAMALNHITDIRVQCKCVISVENLTTYHDTAESNAAVFYLGGFPNHVRVSFLKLLYQKEPQAQYFHRGDLDPYGFLILENLRHRTQIPFEALEMDLDTLKSCFSRRYYRPLNAQDKKIMQHPMLSQYQDIFEFMCQHNCKIEQECFEAMKLEL